MMQTMLKWLVESIVFGFGASAGRDIYKGAKEAAKDDEAPPRELTEEERREARIRAEMERLEAEQRAAEEAKRRAAAARAAEEARRKAEAKREAEIDDELAALKKRLGKK